MKKDECDKKGRKLHQNNPEIMFNFAQESKNKIMNKKIPILQIGLHCLFWAIICYSFLSNSFLRPIAEPYKEILNVCFIVIMVYFNYFYLIPRYFLQGKLTQYWIFAIVTILMAGIGESFLFKPEIYNGFEDPVTIDVNAFLRLMLSITIRTFCFFLLFFLLKLYQKVVKIYLLEKQVLAKNKNTIILMSHGKIEEIKIPDLVYLSQRRNSTYYYLLNGKIVKNTSTLAYAEEILPKEIALKISRTYIVLFSQITGFNDNNINLNLYINGKQVTLPITSNNKEEILCKLKNNASNFFGQKKDDVRRKNENVRRKRTKNDELSEEKEDEKEIILQNISKKQILSHIFQYPGCNIPYIAKRIDATYRTTSRYLKMMKQRGLIEYRGATKKGGYYLTEKGKRG